MPESPYYDRLRQVSELGDWNSFIAIGFSFGASEDFELNAARHQLDVARGLVAKVLADPGITGEAKAVIAQRLKEDIAALDTRERSLNSLRAAYADAQSHMKAAKDAFAELLAELVTPFEKSLVAVS